MFQIFRDAVIALFVLYILIVAVWARMYPTAVGEWLARMDMGYEAVWYYVDCDCTEPLE